MVAARSPLVVPRTARATVARWRPWLSLARRSIVSTPEAVASEYRVLLRLSWPAVFMQIGLMLSTLAETLMLARFDVHSLAAGALGAAWQWTWMSLGSGIVSGIDPLISQAHGRGDREEAVLALQRGLVIAAVAAIPLSLLQLLTGPALIALGQPQEVAELAHRYNCLKLPTLPCYLVYWALRQYLQGKGLLGRMVGLIYAGAVLNVALGWILIFGASGIPSLGLDGAAIASSVSAIVLVATASYACRRLAPSDRPFRRWDARSFALRPILRTLRYGVPLGLQAALESLAFTIAAVMAGWLGSVSVGAHQIVLSTVTATYMLPLGISAGAATRVGHLIGQGDAATMRRAMRAALVLGASIAAVAALVFTLLPRALAGVYTDDPTLAALAARLLPVAAVFQIAEGAHAIAASILRAMGRPEVGALPNMACTYGIALPLAYVLSFGAGLGLVGIWLGMTVALLAAVAILLVCMTRISRQSIARLRVDHARRPDDLLERQ